MRDFKCWNITQPLRNPVKTTHIYQAEDGAYDDEHEDEPGDGDADGEVALREADRRRVVDRVLQHKED